MATRKTVKGIGGKKTTTKKTATANKTNRSTREATTKARKKRMLAALTKCLGNVSEASKIAKVCRYSHYEYCKTDPDYKKDVEEIEKKSLDFTESKMFELINGYSHEEDKIFIYKGKPIVVKTIKHYPPDARMIQFHLSTKGKERGFAQTQININRNVKDPVDEMTDEELDAAIQEQNKRLGITNEIGYDSYTAKTEGRES